MAKSEPPLPDAVATLCERLGLTKRPARLDEALTHPSYANEHRDDRTDNQRLEFLGDAVLGLCVSEQLMGSFGDVDEGTLTVMRASLVNTEALADAARKLALPDALRLGRGADAAGERHRINVLADGIEAVIGAVFLDGGLQAARAVSRIVAGDALADLLAAGGIDRDPKSRLQELMQARGLETPTYEVIAVDGPPHARLFTVRVVVALENDGESLVGEGQGRSKKLSEQASARDALVNLERSVQAGAL
jgi:ribonuclease-3